MTRLAVIGAGAMGRNHVRVYQEMPEADLVAIVDQDRPTAEQLGRIYRTPVYTDIHDMLAREKPDAVSVVVPTNAHFKVAKTVLEADCDVLVEKPIAGTVAEAEELIRISEERGRVLAVGHIERFNPAVVELKRRLDAGELGRVFQIHARRLGPFPARIRDVGVVMDLAIHDLDIMLHLLGCNVTRVFAEARRELHAHCEDLFVSVLRFADNTVGLLEINWLTPTKIRNLYVTGERGMFMVDYITQDLNFFENAATNGNSWSALSLLQGVSQGARVQYPLRKKEPLRAELESFVARVQGQDTAVVDGYQATASLRLAALLADAAWHEGIREVQNESGKSSPSQSASGTRPVPATEISVR